MKTIFFILGLCMAICLPAQTTQGIQFSDASFQSVLRQAKKDHKLVFVDCYTTWCGPCKWMDKNVYINDTAGQFFNANFISIKMDMESKEGKKLNEQYTVLCYPTYLFIDETGTAVHRAVGGYKLKDFIAIGETALDTSKRFGKLEAIYTTGKANTNQFIRYAQARQSVCLSYKEMLANYEAMLTEPDLVSPSAWKVLNQLVSSTDSRIFQYLIKHRDLYDVQFTKDSVDRVIENLYLHAMNQTLWSGETVDTAKYNYVRNTVAQLNMPVADKILAKGDINFYYAMKDWKLYAITTIKFMEQYGHTESYMSLNDYAWHFYENVGNIDHLTLALSWVKQSISLYPDYFNTDTYAALLYKIGRYKEAKTWAGIAIELGKAGGMNYSETEKLLEKIQAEMGE